MLAHVGSCWLSQWRDALRRPSSIHSRSSFLAEMKRTTSSLNPGSRVSCSTSVMKPNLYSCVANCSMVSVDVGVAVKACMGSLFLDLLLPRRPGEGIPAAQRHQLLRPGILRVGHLRQV